MPDYEFYNGQRSGLEIDQGVEMALKVRNTAGYIRSDGNGGLLPATIVNPNLLDNWYFANPVDQRGGYVVKPGASYFNLSDSTVAGTTDKYYKVGSISTDGYANAIFTIDGTQYYTTKANYVRGYTDTGYTIDRWRLSGAGSVVLVENDCVRLKSANAFYQPIENPEKFAGKTVTFSLLIECVVPGAGQFGFVVDDKWLTGLALPKTVGEKTVASVTVNFPESVTKFSAWYYGAEGTDYKIYAAKLELGDQQTLAHLENGNWVLNEIPNYAEELAKCHRYYYKITANTQSMLVGLAVAHSATYARFYPHIPSMRQIARLTIDYQGVKCLPVGTALANAFDIDSVSGGYYSEGNQTAQVDLTKTNDFTQGDIYQVVIAQGGYISFDANL